MLPVQASFVWFIQWWNDTLNVE